MLMFVQPSPTPFHMRGDAKRGGLQSDGQRCKENAHKKGDLFQIIVL